MRRLKKRFSNLISMFFPNLDDERIGFQIDDVIVFTISKHDLGAYVSGSMGDVVHLGYSTTDKDKILRLVDMESIRTAMRIISSGKKNRDISIFEEFNVPKIIRDINKIESHLKNRKWEETQ